MIVYFDSRPNDKALAEEVRRLSVRNERRALPVVAVAATATHAGRIRPINEDFAVAAALFGRRTGAEGLLAADGILLGVFDGSSGFTSAETFVQALHGEIRATLQKSFLRAGAQTDAWARCLFDVLPDANRRIRERDGERLRDVGCCATLLTVSGGTALIGHVGDTRGYLFRDGDLVRVTRDHTLVRKMVEEGKLTEKDARTHHYQNILLRSVFTEVAEIDVIRIPLRRGDVVLLATDGLWREVEESEIRGCLRLTPDVACRALIERTLAAKARDNVAVVVARFDGEGLPKPDGSPVTADPFVPTAHTLATASLATRAEPLVYRRSAGDRGAIPVLDAALLPDGKLLVALGEIGVWVLSREGKVAHRFAEPAHRLVVSDHGDRALALAPRGRATGLTRLARLDILGRRARPWCEMRLTTWAEDYDGSLWFTGEGSTLYAIDATRDRATSLWKVDSGSPGSRLGFIARASTNLSAVFSRSSMDGGSLRTEHEVWNFELPVLRLRARTALPEREEPVQVFAVSATGGVVGRSESSLWLGRSPGGWTLLAAAIDTVFPCAFSENWVACQIGADSNRAEIRLFDVAEARERARMELEGTELPPRVRIQGDKLVVCDRAGRVIVLSLATGAILRDFRVA